MKIIIDSREPGDTIDIIKSTTEKYDIEIEKKHLFVGDYVIETSKDTIAIERKTVTDFIMGIQSGRLATQLYKMSSNFEISYIVIIGIFSAAGIHTEMKRSSYLASVINASLKRSPEGKRGQIISVNLENEYDFALFIAMLTVRLEKGSRTRLPVIESLRDDSTSSKAAIFTAVQGIGIEKAKEIMKHFGTVKKAVNSDPDEFMKIKGIGKKSAENIHSFFNE